MGQNWITDNLIDSELDTEIVKNSQKSPKNGHFSSLRHYPSIFGSFWNIWQSQYIYILA